MSYDHGFYEHSEGAAEYSFPAEGEYHLMLGGEAEQHSMESTGGNQREHYNQGSGSSGLQNLQMSYGDADDDSECSTSEGVVTTTSEEYGGVQDHGGSHVGMQQQSQGVYHGYQQDETEAAQGMMRMMNSAQLTVSQQADSQQQWSTNQASQPQQYQELSSSGIQISRTPAMESSDAALLQLSVSSAITVGRGGRAAADGNCASRPTAVVNPLMGAPPQPGQQRMPRTMNQHQIQMAYRSPPPSMPQSYTSQAPRFRNPTQPQAPRRPVGPPRQTLTLPATVRRTVSSPAGQGTAQVTRGASHGPRMQQPQLQAQQQHHVSSSVAVSHSPAPYQQVRSSPAAYGSTTAAMQVQSSHVATSQSTALAPSGQQVVQVAQIDASNQVVLQQIPVVATVGRVQVAQHHAQTYVGATATNAHGTARYVPATYNAQSGSYQTGPRNQHPVQQHLLISGATATAQARNPRPQGFRGGRAVRQPNATSIRPQQVPPDRQQSLSAVQSIPISAPRQALRSFRPPARRGMGSSPHQQPNRASLQQQHRLTAPQHQNEASEDYQASFLNEMHMEDEEDEYPYEEGMDSDEEDWEYEEMMAAGAFGNYDEQGQFPYEGEQQMPGTHTQVVRGRSKFMFSGRGPRPARGGVARGGHLPTPGYPPPAYPQQGYSQGGKTPGVYGQALLTSPAKRPPAKKKPASKSPPSKGVRTGGVVLSQPPPSESAGPLHSPAPTEEYPVPTQATLILPNQKGFPVPQQVAISGLFMTREKRKIILVVENNAPPAPGANSFPPTMKDVVALVDQVSLSKPQMMTSDGFTIICKALDGNNQIDTEVHHDEATIQALAATTQQVQKTTVTSTSPAPTPSATPSASSSPQLPSSNAPQPYKPLLKPGFLALCTNCGMASPDFFKCIRCKKQLPEDCKTVPDGKDSGGEIPPGFTGKVSCFASGSVTIQSRQKSPSAPLKRKRKEEPECLTLSSDEGEGEEYCQPEDGTPPAVPDSSTGGDSGLGSDDLCEPFPSEHESDSEYDLDEGHAVVSTTSTPTEGGAASQSSTPAHPHAVSSTDVCSSTERLTGGGHRKPFISMLPEELPDPHIRLKIKKVHIGSYCWVSDFKEILLDTDGISVMARPLDQGPADDEIQLFLDVHDLMGIWISANDPPVIFIYVRRRLAASIASTLKMSEESGPYFNCGSQDERVKRIIVFMDPSDEQIGELAETLGTWYKDAIKKGCSILAVDAIKAKTVLCNALPEEFRRRPDVNSLASGAQRSEQAGQSSNNSSSGFTTAQGTDNRVDSKSMQTRSKTAPPHPGMSPDEDTHRTLFKMDGFDVKLSDYMVLEEEQFLNDTVIDFYLQYIWRRLTDRDRNRTHVFNSYFYKVLTAKSKTTPSDAKLSPAEKRHARVRGWTKNIDIFTKDFLIIPINEHSHWFLAVICFPYLTGPVRASDDEPVVIPPNRKPRKNPTQKALATLIKMGSTTITRVEGKKKVEVTPDHAEVPCEGDSDSERDEAEGDEHEMDEIDGEDAAVAGTNPSAANQSAAAGEGAAAAEPPADAKADAAVTIAERDDEIKMPMIMIFDSLMGASRARIVATLRDYLTVEYKAKRGETRKFCKDTMRGVSPRVPQQTNYSDCGIFVLQYTKSFFESPLKSFRLPIKGLEDWFSQEIMFTKRKEIAQLFANLAKQHNPKAAPLPALLFSCDDTSPSPGAAAGATPNSQEEEEAMTDAAGGRAPPASPKKPPGPASSPSAKRVPERPGISNVLMSTPVPSQALVVLPKANLAAVRVKSASSGPSSAVLLTAKGPQLNRPKTSSVPTKQQPTGDAVAEAKDVVNDSKEESTASAMETEEREVVFKADDASPTKTVEVENGSGQVASSNKRQVDCITDLKKGGRARTNKRSKMEEEGEMRKSEVNASPQMRKSEINASSQMRKSEVNASPQGKTAQQQTGRSKKDSK